MHRRAGLLLGAVIAGAAAIAWRLTPPPAGDAALFAPHARTEGSAPGIGPTAPSPLDRRTVTAESAEARAAAAQDPPSASEASPSEADVASLPPPPLAAREDRHLGLARWLDAPDPEALAQRLRTWQREHDAASREALAQWRQEAALDPSASAHEAFNRRMQTLAEDLERRFGAADAARIVRAGGFYRADLRTGEISAVDLEGHALPPRLDPSE